MIDGNKKIFERLWKLTLKLNQYLEASSKNSSNLTTPNSTQSAEIKKLRNSQLSMVLLRLRIEINQQIYKFVYISFIDRIQFD